MSSLLIRAGEPGIDPLVDPIFTSGYGHIWHCVQGIRHFLEFWWKNFMPQLAVYCRVYGEHCAPSDKVLFGLYGDCKSLVFVGMAVIHCDPKFWQGKILS